MLKTFNSSTMTEVPSGPSTESSDDLTTSTYPAYAVPQPALLPEPPRRRQRRSCDSCRRGKRACDAEKCADFANQTCSNCLRKNQVCTFNWLKTASENHQDRERKRRRSSFQSSNGYTEGSTSTRSHSFQSRPRLRSIANNTHYELPDRSAQWLSSLSENGMQEDCFNIAPIEDAKNGTNEAISFDELSPVQSRKSSKLSFFDSCRSGRSSFDTGPHRRYHKNDSTSPFRDILLGERSSRGFVTNGLLRIYNDSMENSLSCWLTEHNCPYNIKHCKPPSISAKKASREWGSSWSNRMYNRVIQLDRAYASLRIRDLTAEEERTVAKALNMAIVAFASQWAQAGQRGTKYHATDSHFTGDEFPQSNGFERSMQESLWHQTSELLHRAARIDSFRVVFALIIFSLTQRPLDVTRPMPRPDRNSKIDFEYFQSLIQDDDAPVFLEAALRQILAQRRKLERLEREMASKGNGEPKDPLSEEDRDTFNLLYWLGVMFDTLSAAICERAVVVDDEDCELPQPVSDSHRYRESPACVPPKMYGDQFATAEHLAQGFGGGNRALPAPKDTEVWGDLFTRDGTLEVDPEAARWPCSYKLAAATLSSAAPVKVLLFRRVAHLQALVSRKVSPSRIELGINSAFQVYNHWNRTYAPFFSDCVQHHTTLPQRVQSWYILLAGHWHLATFLLSDLLATIDATKLSLPNERAFRQASNLVATLRRQNALAVADLSLASIHSASHSASHSESTEDFHFALNQAALLTEPWTVVFVRSLCRAGYVLVQIAADDASEEEREQARRRCGDCIEGLWYLGRKSDMAFLAARCLTDMLDEAIRDTTATSNMAQPSYEGDGSDGTGTASSQFDTDPSPQTVAEMAGYQQPFEQIAAFPEWSSADPLAGYQADGGWEECDVLNLQTPLDLDSATLWDFSLHC